MLYWRLMPKILLAIKGTKLVTLWDCAFDTVASDIYLNLLLFLCLLVACSAFVYRRYKDYYFSTWYLLGAIWGIWAVGYGNLWRFIPIWRNVDYSWLLYAFFAVVIFVECAKKRWQKSKFMKNPELLDYMTDKDFRNDDFSPRRYMLACDIAKRLLKTSTDNGSFAVSITGQWGTGKTRFLNLLRDEMKEYAYVVDFRPWDSQDPKQIVNDFFSTLRDALSPYYSPISRPLSQYAELLNGLEIHPLQKWVSDRLVHHYQENINASKTTLSDYLNELRYPVVVFVDDMDRLEADEAFEVLRLIRNTANLQNVYYVAAYDKSYFVGMLKSKGMPNAAQYLEKIFQLEVPMPAVESYEVANMLLGDLNWMLASLSYNPTLKMADRLDMPNRVLISKVVGNFRQARRIARLMSSQISTVGNYSDIDFIDLLWLDILYATDVNVYDTLMNNPQELLYLAKTDGYANYHYELKNNVVEQNAEIKETYLGPTISDNAKVLLRQLFGKRNRTKYSIIYQVNYFRYFYLGIERWALSESDFRFMLCCDEERENQMARHFTTKSPASIYHLFRSKSMPSDWRGVKQYLMVLFGWMRMQTFQEMPQLVYDSLRFFQYKNFDTKEARTWIIEEMGRNIDASSNYLQIAKVLYKLYEDCDVSRMPENYPFVYLMISNEDVAELIKLNFKRFLESDSFDAADIVDKNSLLGEMYRYTVCTIAYNVEDDCRSVAYLGAEIAISHFSLHKSFKYQEFDSKFNIDSDLADDQAYIQSEQENIENRIETLFGFDEKQDYFKRYSQECFVRPDEADSTTEHSE